MKKSELRNRVVKNLRENRQVGPYLVTVIADIAQEERDDMREKAAEIVLNSELVTRTELARQIRDLK